LTGAVQLTTLINKKSDETIISSFVYENIAAVLYFTM